MGVLLIRARIGGRKGGEEGEGWSCWWSPGDAVPMLCHRASRRPALPRHRRASARAGCHVGPAEPPPDEEAAVQLPASARAGELLRRRRAGARVGRRGRGRRWATTPLLHCSQASVWAAESRPRCHQAIGDEGDNIERRCAN